MNEILIHFIHSELLNRRSDIQVGENDDLLAMGTVDSIGMLRIIQFVESRFTLSIPFDDVTIENFGTVAAMSDYLKRRGASQ